MPRMYRGRRPLLRVLALLGPSGESAATPTSYTLVNRDSGKCLDLNGSSSADGANVQQWTCTGGADLRQWTWLDNNCRQWRLVPAA
ncbi:RICIN domain-containing protein [Streptomyces acidiscabies]|uniref:RICIN domain-containing protein n=1 Tax=Streptomyces acidiscabies TaxID=42234 RepID=UPI0038F74037